MILKHVPNSYMCFTCIRLPDWRETVWYAGVAVQVSRNQQESRTTNEFLAHFLSSPLFTLSLVQSLYVLPFHTTVSRLGPNSNRRGRKRAGERR